jgi:hypothetical protein
MDCVRSDSEATPKSVSLIPIVSNRQGKENWGRELDEQQAEDADRLVKKDECLGSLEFRFRTL